MRKKSLVLSCFFARQHLCVFKRALTKMKNLSNFTISANLFFFLFFNFSFYFGNLHAKAIVNVALGPTNSAPIRSNFLLFENGTIHDDPSNDAVKSAKITSVQKLKMNNISTSEDTFLINIRLPEQEKEEKIIPIYVVNATAKLSFFMRTNIEKYQSTAGTKIYTSGLLNQSKN
jgi:hypothetical protein